MIYLTSGGTRPPSLPSTIHDLIARYPVSCIPGTGLIEITLSTIDNRVLIAGSGLIICQRCLTNGPDAKQS